MDKPMTATEIIKRRERGCDCNQCEFCYAEKRIEHTQRLILKPLIERTQELIYGR